MDTAEENEEEEIREWARQNPAFEHYIERRVAKEVDVAKQQVNKNKTSKGRGKFSPQSRMKSPSDTTLYAPVLQKKLSECK